MRRVRGRLYSKGWGENSMLTWMFCSAISYITSTTTTAISVTLPPITIEEIALLTG